MQDLPQRPNLVLSSNIPHGKLNVLVVDRPEQGHAVHHEKER